MICPKCGNKIPKDGLTCPYCKTSVEKIVKASNKEAKRALRNKEKDRVVLTSYRPEDVKKSKLILLTIFLGWAGAHCYYVGRMGRGFLMLLCLVIGFACVATPETWAIHAYVGGIVAGIFGFINVFIWWTDIVSVCFDRFKIPVVLKGEELPKDEE